MIKRTDTIEEWQLTDAKRNVTNGANNASLKANSSAAETVNSTWTLVDLLSNGFKQRYTDGLMNGSGATYIYMAFDENPFVTSGGIPTTAR
jgi:Mg-chelatase subunit ChlD